MSLIPCHWPEKEDFPTKPELLKASIDLFFVFRFPLNPTISLLEPQAFSTLSMPLTDDSLLRISEGKRSPQLVTWLSPASLSASPLSRIGAGWFRKLCSLLNTAVAIWHRSMYIPFVLFNATCVVISKISRCSLIAVSTERILSHRDWDKYLSLVLLIHYYTTVLPLYRM